MTIVVLDTRKGQEVVHATPSPVLQDRRAAASEEEKTPAPSPPKQPPLGPLLSPRRIIIWDQPVHKETALRTLVDAAASDGEIRDPAAILAAVLAREEVGSTFFNEGVAFPHARVETVDDSVVAMGITRKGVSDVATEKPVEFIFLVLSPARFPDTQVRILGTLARVSRNRHLLLEIQSCRTPEDVLSAVDDWEARQAIGAAEAAP
jgi:two-component system sensor histidine kinase KdpD